MYKEGQDKYDAAKKIAADKGIDIDTGKPFAGTTEEITYDENAEAPKDATPGTPGTPGSPHGSGWLWMQPTPATPAVPGTPAVAGHPVIHHRRTVPVTNAAQPPLAPGLPNLAPSNSPAASKATEVTRMTKDGRKAIFDANTKQFLRYAD
jgi:hypothetical protein